jgi:hypothetical protein
VCVCIYANLPSTPGRFGWEFVPIRTVQKNLLEDEGNAGDRTRCVPFSSSWYRLHCVTSCSKFKNKYIIFATIQEDMHIQC